MKNEWIRPWMLILLTLLLCVSMFGLHQIIQRKKNVSTHSAPVPKPSKFESPEIPIPGSEN